MSVQLQFFSKVKKLHVFKNDFSSIILNTIELINTLKFNDFVDDFKVVFVRPLTFLFFFFFIFIVTGNKAHLDSTSVKC